MDCTSCVYFCNKSCTWFETPKVIPKDVCGKGCKFYKAGKIHPLFNDIITMFNGKRI